MSQQLLMQPRQPPSPLLRSRSRVRVRVRALLRAALLLTIWYLASSVAIILTKTLFSGSARLNLRAFPFALTVTATNNVVATALTVLVLGPPADSLSDASVHRLAMLIGATTAAEIGLSNTALTLLSVAYSTVLKGMAPLFVMGWAVALGLQPLRAGTCSAMALILVGLLLAVAGEVPMRPSSRLFAQHAGIVAQLCSGLLSGFRWVLTQVFVKGEAISNDRIAALLRVRPLRGALTPSETIRLTAPNTLIAVMPFVAVVEGVGLISWVAQSSVMDLINLGSLLATIGLCVSVLLWAEYELVKLTSSLTMAVGFVVKEVLVIFAGALVLEERISTMTCVGFAVVQVGVVVYAMLRRRAAIEAAAALAAASETCGGLERAGTSCS